MFFIMGISPRRIQLDFTQTITCDACGHFGRYEVWLTYMCFTLFFIPIFKWGRQYTVTTSCCGNVYILDEEKGRAIERGENVKIYRGDLTLYAEGSAESGYNPGSGYGTGYARGYGADGFYGAGSGYGSTNDSGYCGTNAGGSGNGSQAVDRRENTASHYLTAVKICPNCGYRASEEFEFCPMCGNKL